MAGKKSKHDEQQQESPDPILSSDLIEFCTTTIADWHPRTLKIAREEVQPYLADSGMAFLMNGKDCHLSSDAPPLARIAAMALTLKAVLPFVEANGNPTEVKYVAMALGLFSVALMYPLTGGKALDEVVAGYAAYLKERRESRLDKGKLKDVKDIIFQLACAKVGYGLEDVAKEVAKHCGIKVSGKTMGRELKKRGITLPSKRVSKERKTTRTAEASTSVRKKNR